MNKNEFIEILKSNLSKLPKDEIDDIIYDYEEHFRIGLENGKAESEICSELGNPKAISKQFFADKSLQIATNNTTYKNTLRAIFAIAALGFFNLVLVLGPFIGLVGVIISFYATGISFVFSGVATFFASLLDPFVEAIYVDMNIISALCFSIFFVCIGLLILIGTFYLTKILLNILMKYLKWNLDLIKG